MNWLLYSQQNIFENEYIKSLLFLQEYTYPDSVLTSRNQEYHYVLEPIQKHLYLSFLSCVDWSFVGNKRKNDRNYFEVQCALTINFGEIFRKCWISLLVVKIVVISSLGHFNFLFKLESFHHCRNMFRIYTRLDIHTDIKE